MEKHGFVNYPKEWWHFTLQDEPFKMINIDLQQELTKFSQQFSKLDFLHIDQLIEDTRWQLNHNSHIGLTLTNLSISIRNEIIKN